MRPDCLRYATTVADLRGHERFFFFFFAFLQILMTRFVETTEFHAYAYSRLNKHHCGTL